MNKENLKAGYKWTEVGVIPEDWEIPQLDKVATLKARIGWQGLTTAEYRLQGDYLLVTGTEFKDGKIDWESCFFVDYERFKQDKNIQLKANDVLVTKDGTIGKIAFIDDLPMVATLNSGVFVIRPIKESYESKFFYYLLRSKYFHVFLDKLAAGSTISHLYQKDFVHFSFPLPTILEEQQAIATALSDIDELIAQLDKLIIKKRNIIKATMQQLLTGKKRLPGFIGDWEIKRLGEIAEIKTGSKNNQDKIVDGKYPFFVRSQTIEKINTFTFDCEAILVPGEGGIGSIYHYINGKFDVHQRVYKISGFITNVSGKYVYLYMKQFFNVHAMKNSVKATVDSLRLPTFLEFEIKLPTNEEQNNMVLILSAMDSEIEILEQKRDKYKVIKEGMMQELLTGKTRLIMN
jgi:type I restriction enzyme S subunit